MCPQGTVVPQETPIKRTVIQELEQTNLTFKKSYNCGYKNCRGGNRGVSEKKYLMRLCVSEKCKAQQIEVYRSYHQNISESIASVALQWYTQITAIVQEIQGLGQTNLTYEKAKRMAVNSVR